MRHIDFDQSAQRQGKGSKKQLKLRRPASKQSAELPVLAFGDGDTGFFQSADDVLELTTNGVSRMKWDAGGIITAIGNLVVSGVTTTIDSTTLTVDDKNIELGSVATPSDTTADGGGITLKGATDKTFNWVDSTDAWTSSEHINLASGKTFQLNGTAITSTAAELNLLDGVTATTAEINLLDGATSTASEINILTGVTATAAELNIMDGVTASTAELNILDGVTASTAELNLLDGGFSDNDNDTMIQFEESADEDKIRFDTAGTERMVIDATGVGVGNIPQCAFQVGNSLSTFPSEPMGMFLRPPSGTNNFTGLHSGSFHSTFSNDTTALKLWPNTTTRAVNDYCAGINFMHLNAQGYPTHTGGHAAIAIRLYDTPAAERSSLCFLVNSATGTGSQPTEKMCIRPDGNVGIGTTSPTGGLLHVNGDIYCNDISVADIKMSNDRPDVPGNEIDGTKGSWVFQEGDENMYLINKNSGKRYKLKLEEV
jgi:hypothetical protein